MHWGLQRTPVAHVPHALLGCSVDPLGVAQVVQVARREVEGVAQVKSRGIAKGSDWLDVNAHAPFLDIHEDIQDMATQMVAAFRTAAAAALCIPQSHFVPIRNAI